LPVLAVVEIMLSRRRLHAVRESGISVLLFCAAWCSLVYGLMWGLAHMG
jgi:hypothetical protein